MSDQFSSPAPVPRRPDPQQRTSERVIDQLQSRWHQLRGEPDDAGDHGLDVADIDPGGSRQALALGVLIAVGAVLLALGSLYAWQTWSQRSAPPIDDLLPVLVTSGGDPVAPADAGTPADAPDAIEPVGTGTAAERVEAEPAPIVEATPVEPPNLVVHVSGAVRQPGIVELAPGSRVYQAVDEAGGAVPTADLERVNLAAPLGDGERIHVPRVGEDELPVVVQPEPASPLGADDASAALEDLLLIIDINSASEVELETLPGVGPSIAQAIVNTRTERGPYLHVDELREVPGIGEAKLAALLPYVVVIEP